jgi:activating signal cointegrator complex subunit 1
MRVRLLHLVPTYEALATTSKVHLIQSIVSRLFVNFIFDQYFVGLPKEQADELKSVERYLGSFGELYRRSPTYRTD